MKAEKKQIDGFLKMVEKDQQILAVFLFGSAGRGESTAASDVDICLVLKQKVYLSAELSQKKLEYLKFFDMDIQIFQQLPIYMRIRIIKEGRQLFCSDQDRLYEIAFDTMREFEDFRPFYEDYLREVANVR